MCALTTCGKVNLQGLMVDLAGLRIRELSYIKSFWLEDLQVWSSLATLRIKTLRARYAIEEAISVTESFEVSWFIETTNDINKMYLSAACI